MKNRLITSLLFIIAGLFTILAPTVLFPVCEIEMKMACYFTKQAEIGVGALIIVLGLISLILSDKKVRLGISLSQFFNAILVLLLPLKLTGLCKMDEMACRAGTLPALIVISVILLLTAGLNTCYLAFAGRKDA